MKIRNRLWRLLRRTYREYYADRAYLFASAVSFYALISIAPILVISITIARSILGEESAREQIIDQLTTWWGEDVRSFLEASYQRLRQTSSGVLPTIVSAGVVLWGATRTFVVLSASLDAVWEVDPEAAGGWKTQILDRVTAVVVAMGTGIGLVAFTMFSMGLAIIRPYLGYQTVFGPVFHGIQWIGFTVVLAVLCAAVYRVLPHTEIEWKHVWIGAMVTALLLNAARGVIAWYISAVGTQSVYGAAGAVIVILFWIYYSAQIFFMGAEFTYLYARWGNFKARSMRVQKDEHGDSSS